MGHMILVVDDEKPIADILEYNLRSAGYETVAAYDGEEALKLFRELNPDLILLDIMLPSRDGIEICEAIRLHSGVPVLMLTAKDEEEDVICGLDAGADDYITKPFSPREVLARVRAQLRRAEGDFGGQNSTYTCGSLTVDMDRYQAYLDGEDAGLTRREFELLAYLAERQGKVVTRKQLLHDVWGYQYYGDVRTVDVTIRRLREKVEKDPSDPSIIVTRRGVGYLFVGEQEG